MVSREQPMGVRTIPSKVTEAHPLVFPEMGRSDGGEEGVGRHCRSGGTPPVEFHVLQRVGEHPLESQEATAGATSAVD